MKNEALTLAEKRQDALDKVLEKQMAEDGTGEEPANEEAPEEEKTEEELELERKAEEEEKAKAANNEVQKQSVFLSQVMVVWVSQILLSGLITYEVLSDPDILEALSTYPENYWIVAARFVCGIVLHMALQDELKQGLDNMKYSLNHTWRFENYKIAWLSGFLQATIIYIVESVNFLAILTSFTVLDIVMNFLALVVISEFDDFFYEALRNEPLQDLITDPAFEELLMIERTTSRRAKADIPEHELTPDALDINENEMEEMKTKIDIPTHIHQDFKKRSCFGMFGMSIYRIYRIFYVSVWFYFLPFLSLLGSYYVPYFMQKNADPTSVDSTNDPALVQLLSTSLHSLPPSTTRPLSLTGSTSTSKRLPSESLLMKTPPRTLLTQLPRTPLRTRPRTQLPRTQFPRTQLPRIQLPRIQLQRTQLLRTQLPRIKLPRTQLPRTQLLRTPLRKKPLSQRLPQVVKVTQWSYNEKRSI
jgi:hypothetical protein